MAKSLLITLFGIILATDAAILLDIPLMRQLLAFLCFTIVPGFLILHVLKVGQVELTKKLLFSVGLSLSFLLFGGLLINALLPLLGYSTPLSTTALVLSFSSFLIVLSLAAYWRNKEHFHFSFNFKNSSKDQLISPLIFPLLFPLFSALGSYLMNTTGNNVILISMLISMPIYIILLVCFNKRIHPATYPLAIWMMSMALLLMSGLISNYPTGGDVYREYEGFKITSYNLFWSVSSYYSAATACLSTSLLATIYHSLMGINKVWIPKLIYPSIASLIPLGCYALYKNYLTPMQSFLSAFFYIAQIFFINSLRDHMRIEICLLFFALYILLIFEYEIRGWQKSFMLIMFLLSIVMTYYVLPLIFFYLLFCLFIASKLWKDSFRSLHGISTSIIALCGATIFLWWSQLTVPIFNTYVVFIHRTFQHLADLFVDEMHCEEVQMMVGVTELSLPMRIATVVHDLTFILIFIGVIALIIGALRGRPKIFDIPYLVSMTAILLLLSAVVILPYISTCFGGSRMYQIGLVITAPALIVGVRTITISAQRLYQKNYPRKILLEWRGAGWKIAVVIILILQFSCASGLLHQALGEPFSEFINTNGVRRGINYIYDSDVSAARWLYENTEGEIHVARDWAPAPAGIFGFITKTPYENSRIIREGFCEEGLAKKDVYIFLRPVNLKTGLLYEGMWSEPSEFATYSHLMERRNKIYAGSAEIWR